jgi:hypothetical protein
VRDRDARAPRMKAVLGAAARGDDRARGPSRRSARREASWRGRATSCGRWTLLREVDRLG